MRHKLFSRPIHEQKQINAVCRVVANHDVNLINIGCSILFAAFMFSYFYFFLCFAAFFSSINAAFYVMDHLLYVIFNKKNKFNVRIQVRNI